jgi:hypothetical protein
MFTILLIVLILLLLGALPTWPYSRSWGYYPSGGLGLVVVILVILILFRMFWIATGARLSFYKRTRTSPVFLVVPTAGDYWWF